MSQSHEEAGSKVFLASTPDPVACPNCRRVIPADEIAAGDYDVGRAPKPASSKPASSKPAPSKPTSPKPTGHPSLGGRIMGWFRPEKLVEYRLLDKRTSAGGVVFWIRDAAKAENGEFLNKILVAELGNLPAGFLVRMTNMRSGTAIPVQLFRLPDGFELHIDIPD